MSYPQQFIEELIRRNDIEQVISRYVDLKRAGSNLVGRCPFHSEKTPSFTVFSDTNFYCFGCGAGGDVITFIMRIENLDYQSAVNFLADRAGLTVPSDNFEKIPKKVEVLTRERNYEINKAAAKIFYENLNSPEGEKARRYLSERELSKATQIRFGIGFSKDGYTDLYDKLSSRGFTLDEIKAAFLCGISKNGTPYDYFRNRVIFPIIDLTGKVVAFGGRVMGEGEPKYLNSSDTPVFKKSRTLFALNFAKMVALENNKSDNPSRNEEKGKAGELILCEGYMDVIALHQAGFSNAVATLGTAITSEQARLMARYAKTVYICYDSDAAGRRATDKAIRLLSEAGLDVKVLCVTGGAKDPDEYIKKYGADAFSRLMSGANGQIDYQIGEILKKYNLDIPDEKLSAVTEACGMLSGIFPEIKREIYISRLSELTGVNKEILHSDIKRRQKSAAATVKKRLLTDSENKLRHYGDKINPDAVKYSGAVEIEERILGILLLYPELMPGKEVLSSESFVTKFNAILFSRISELIGAGEFDISMLNENYSPEEMGRIHTMRRQRAELSANGKDTLYEQISALKKRKQLTDSLKASEMTNEQWLKSLEEKRKAHHEREK